MKVIVSTRMVFHKTAEVVIDVPSHIHQDKVLEWLQNEESSWEDKICDAVVDAEYNFGFGMDEGNWTDSHSNCETRYDLMQNGKHLEGGHL